MEKRTVTLKYTLVFEVDEASLTCESFKESVEKGFIKIIKNETSMSTDNGIVCYDESALKEVKDALIHGLIGRV